jgi:prepilin-type N-terminal cleavage/methylation domain-containing protein
MPTLRRNYREQKGFTLLELLIVIGIIAILSVVLIFVLNPAETLQKSRDTQRISDLATLKTALGLYMTARTTPQLDGTSGTVNDKCDGGTAANEELWVSVNTTAGGGEDITDATPPSGWVQAAARWEQNTSATTQSLADGTGWIPVNLSSITGGSPISSIPVDPVNDLSITTGADASTAAAVTNGALMYRYACKKSPLSFEVAARLESTSYGVGGDDDRAAKDGGNNIRLYEVGTDLTILPSTNDY